MNGFYLGKLRGLLGDGNNEPFDDFRLPNGKVTFISSSSIITGGSVVRYPSLLKNRLELHSEKISECPMKFFNLLISYLIKSSSTATIGFKI